MRHFWRICLYLLVLHYKVHHIVSFKNVFFWSSLFSLTLFFKGYAFVLVSSQFLVFFIRALSTDMSSEGVYPSLFMSGLTGQSDRTLSLCWEQHCKLLPGVQGIHASQVATWSVDEVRGCYKSPSPSCIHSCLCFDHLESHLSSL